MLYAIDHNKAGKNFQSEIDWRSLFTTSEDSLTSSVFSLLFYLPVELFWSILTKACYTALPVNASPIERFEFWPHWGSNGTQNSNYVEPDIFIRFRDVDLIVEAKRLDYNQQNENQWRSELQAYLNEEKDKEESNSRKVIFLAIGGISKSEEEIRCVDSKKFSIIKCRWGRLLQQVKSHLNLINKSKLPLSSTDSIIHILNDLVLAFRLHGYSTGEWFESMESHSYSLNSNSIKFLLEYDFNKEPV